MAKSSRYFPRVRQRWLHYYCANELIHLAVFLLLATHSEKIPVWVGIGALNVLVNYLLFYASNCLIFVAVIFTRRALRGTDWRVAAAPRFPVPTFKESHVSTLDGVDLRVCVAQGDPGAPCMLLAAPLGQCGPSVYAPIMAFYGPQFTYVTWDYRGFFGSGDAGGSRKISIHQHALDAIQVLDGTGFATADVMVGFSMGTAVAFEAVLIFPSRVKRLIILNGFHGHVFQTAFQPIFRMAFAGDLVAKFVELLVRHPNCLAFTWRILRRCSSVAMPIYVKAFGSPLLRKLQGDDYLEGFFNTYFGRLIQSPKDLALWLRLFQELDAHSVYHVLPEITQPVLLVSGALDLLTPAMQSVEIARRIPHAVHYCDPLSSHMCLLESPEWCVAEIVRFLQETSRDVEPSPRDTTPSSRDVAGTTRGAVSTSKTEVPKVNRRATKRS